MKTWEFTGEVKKHFGITLKRIRSTVDRPTLGISAGDIGGWVEKAENLSDNAWIYDDAMVHSNALVCGNARVCDNARVSGAAWVSGDAWVLSNALVSGNALVFGNVLVAGAAWVSDDAQVFGNALVYGNAWVFGDARVYDDARVSGNALVFGNAQVHSNTRVSDDAWEKSPLYIQGSRWPVCMVTKTKLKIGCQVHTLKQWQNNYLKIAADNKALDIVDEYKLYIDLACSLYLKAEVTT